MTTNSKRLCVLLPAMVLPFIGSLAYFVFLKQSSSAQVVYASIKVFTLLWPIIAIKLILKDPFPAFSLRSGGRRSAIEGIISGFLVGGLTVVLSMTLLFDVAQSAAPHILEKVEQLGVKNNFILFALFISIFHSLIEEYYWRWFVFGYLKQIVSTKKAHIFASLAFTAHHLVVLSQYFSFGWTLFFGFAVAVGGVLWSWMFVRHKSLEGAWISHILVDLGIMWVGYQLISG